MTGAGNAAFSEAGKLPESIRIVAVQGELVDSPLLKGITGQVVSDFDPKTRQGAVIAETAGDDGTLYFAEQLGFLVLEETLESIDFLGRVLVGRLSRLCNGDAVDALAPEFQRERLVRKALERAKGYLLRKYDITATDDEAMWFLRGALSKPTGRRVVFASAASRQQSGSATSLDSHLVQAAPSKTSRNQIAQASPVTETHDAHRLPIASLEEVLWSSQTLMDTMT